MPEFGAPHRHFSRTDSTNTRARELAEAGAPHGTVVTAGEQSEGRGRQGRVWTAPAGKGAALLGDPAPARRAPPAAAARRPARRLRGGREPAPGIDCADQVAERRLDRGAQAGGHPDRGPAPGRLGGDRRRPQPRGRARRVPAPSCAGRRSRSSARASGVADASTEPRRGARLAALDRWVGGRREATILAEWRRRDALRGREIAGMRAGSEGSGVADGVDERGNLLVVTAGGDRVALGAGEVHLRL